jgi:MFS family permease
VSDSSTSSPSRARSLRLVYFAWLFGGFWAAIAGGATFNRFARSLHAPDAAFGLLAAIPYLGAAVQLPVSFLIERGSRRKLVFLIGGLLDRLAWVLIAAVPWVLPERWWWPAFLAGYALAVVGQNTDGPCWISWMADFLPQRIRGRFVSRRSRLGQIMLLLLPVPIGWLLDRAALLGDWHLRLAASGLLALAGLVGSVDILMHLPVPDNVRPPPTAIAHFGRRILQPLRDRSFLRFLGFNSTLIFAVGFLGQYLWLFCFDVLHTTTVQATLLLLIFPIGVSVVCTAFYGPLIDKLGRKPVMVIGAALIIPGAIGWLFMTPGHWWPAYLCILVSMTGWPAVETGRFNVLLAMSETRAGRGGGITYLAVNSAVCALSGALSGLVGSFVARTLGPAWRGDLLGLPLTYHGVLFLVSTLARVAALLWLLRFEEPRAHATREAIRHVALAAFDNVQTVVTLPYRFLRRVGSASFKIRPPWGRE